jgi:hypothetical protein
MRQTMFKKPGPPFSEFLLSYGSSTDEIVTAHSCHLWYATCLMFRQLRAVWSQTVVRYWPTSISLDTERIPSELSTLTPTVITSSCPRVLDDVSALYVLLLATIRPCNNFWLLGRQPG